MDKHYSRQYCWPHTGLSTPGSAAVKSHYATYYYYLLDYGGLCNGESLAACKHYTKTQPQPAPGSWHRVQLSFGDLRSALQLKKNSSQ